MKKLTSEDSTFLDEVVRRAFDIALDNNEDFTLVITKQDIKDNTDRTVVRDVVLEKYSETLAKAYDTTSRVIGDKVVINIPSISPFAQYDLQRLRDESEKLRKSLEEDE